MKITILSVIFFLSACTAAPHRPEVSFLEYDNARTLVVGISSEDDVTRMFGPPSSRAEDGGYHILVYNDPKTDSQRMTVNVHAATQKVSSVLWVPKPQDKQLSAVDAKAGFKNASFKEIIEPSENPHSYTETILFVDEKAGITIRYDKTNDIVEAIAIYDVTNRIPAATQKSGRKVPYTFGDESKVAK